MTFLSIRIKQIIRKKLLIRIIRIFGQRINNHRWETNKQMREPNTPYVPFDVFLFYHPHLTRWNHLHFGVGVVGITQKKVWAAGSPLSEQWNKVRAFEESLRKSCGPTAHRSKDSEIECGTSAPTEWTVKSRWNTFFTFPPFLQGS